MSNVILSAFADEYAPDLDGQIEVLSKYGFKYLEIRHADGQNISTMSQDEVKAIKAYGHTPGHTMYRIEDVVFAGDIMHATALQLVNPESCARFDQNKEMSAQARKDALAAFKAEGLKVYGMHFPEPYYIQF
jgi:glyoxylase-like metal-dependent hydrolase (beta-lactamase superfamily II)